MGAMLGLTGAGGSILAAPLLMFGLGWTLPQAMPVALMAVCAASSFGTIVAWDVTYVRRRAAGLIALAGFITAPLGLAASAALPVSLLTALFASMLVVVAARMAWQARRRPDEARIVRAAVAGEGPPSSGHWIQINERGRITWTRSAVVAVGAIGSVTGFLAGLLGLGGGFVIVPALRALSMLSMHSAVATSLYAVALTSGLTVIAALFQGAHIPWLDALPFVLGALGGMLVGRWLAPRIAGPRLQQVFAGFMAAVALGLVVFL
jgi:uncharacterized protein